MKERFVGFELTNLMKKIDSEIEYIEYSSNIAGEEYAVVNYKQHSNCKPREPKKVNITGDSLSTLTCDVIRALVY